jgi:hypothetical protein
MSIADQTTQPALAAPTVLAIGCPPELSARCAAALEGIGAALKACDIASAATVAAQRQPLAIVLVDDLYAFDPEEFDALARDVRASLVKVPEDIAVEPLRELFAAAIIAAIERRERAPRPPARVVPPPAPSSRQNAATVPNPALLRSLREMGPEPVYDGGFAPKPPAQPAPDPGLDAHWTGVRRRRSSSSSDLDAPPSSHGAGGLG